MGCARRTGFGLEQLLAALSRFLRRPAPCDRRALRRIPAAVYGNSLQRKIDDKRLSLREFGVFVAAIFQLIECLRAVLQPCSALSSLRKIALGSWLLSELTSIWAVRNLAACKNAG